MSCAADAPDQTGCSCSGSETRACYPASANPSTRGVGPCKDGMQTCMSTGEFGTWGNCTGAVTPQTENCTNGVDDNCSGQIDCADPACATDAACHTGCTDGQTRPCYDGPMGTENVGTCKDGTQTCAGGMWPSNCPGEVLPSAENCGDNLDHDCNHLPGCLDLFSCILAPICQQMCVMPLDPGCVCPTGSGDQAMCPAHMHGVQKGTKFPPDIECCPCTANDCADGNCCDEPECIGNSWCTNMTCRTLPSSCNGQVSLDCDDFPEDCDEPCCVCSPC